MNCFISTCIEIFEEKKQIKGIENFSSQLYQLMQWCNAEAIILKPIKYIS